MGRLFCLKPVLSSKFGESSVGSSGLSIWGMVKENADNGNASSVARTDALIFRFAILVIGGGNLLIS